jgi:DNA mismatch repair protein MutL
MVDVKEFIMKMIDAAKEGIGKAKEQVLEAMALSLAQSVSLKAGKKLHSKEMAELVNSLFASPEHTATPDGKPIISILTDDDFEKMFK